MIKTVNLEILFVFAAFLLFFASNYYFIKLVIRIKESHWDYFNLDRHSSYLSDGRAQLLAFMFLYNSDYRGDFEIKRLKHKIYLFQALAMVSFAFPICFSFL